MSPVPVRPTRPAWPTVIVAAFSCAIALLAGSGTSVLDAEQARTRSVNITVVNREGAPVPDVGSNALIVREDGIAREIVRIAPAPPPTHVALLIDDSEAATPLVRDLREAATGFANAIADLSPAPAVRLTTFGDRPTVLVDFNPSFSAVSRGIERIAPRPGAGATLLEALVETGRDLRTRKALRPVIVVFVVEGGPEFGTLRHTDVTDALRRAGASLWTIVLTSREGSGSSDADRERDIVLGDVTTQSGGRNRIVLASQQLPQAFAAVAAALAGQYEVTYGRPDTLIPPKRVDVEARDAALSVLTSRWATP